MEFKNTYLLEFILAEKGCDEIFSSMGRFTEGIGTFEMPLSYNLFFRSWRLDGSLITLRFKSIYNRKKVSMNMHHWERVNMDESGLPFDYRVVNCPFHTDSYFEITMIDPYFLLNV